MLTMYQTPGSVCAQKVRLALAEKHLAWESVNVDLGNREFMQKYQRELNPNAVVPTLVADGQALIESNIILEYLDEAFPAPPLSPASPLERARMRVWMSQLDIDVHVSVNALSFAIAFRSKILQQLPEQRELVYNAIPDLERRWRRRELVEKGVESSLVGIAAQRFARLFRDMDRTLASDPWLAGAAFTLADIALTPYVLRADALGLTPIIDSHTHLRDWYQRVQQRPSFEEATARWGVLDFKAATKPMADQAWPKIVALIKAA